MDSTKKSLDHLTFADLRVHYGTGRAFRSDRSIEGMFTATEKALRQIWETWRKKIGYSWPRV